MAIVRRSPDSMGHLVCPLHEEIFVDRCFSCPQQLRNNTGGRATVILCAREPDTRDAVVADVVVPTAEHGRSHVDARAAEKTHSSRWRGV